MVDASPWNDNLEVETMTRQTTARETGKQLGASQTPDTQLTQCVHIHIITEQKNHEMRTRHDQSYIVRYREPRSNRNVRAKRRKEATTTE